MAKVTIEIDDTNPTLVAAFGSDALTAVAIANGYRSEVPDPTDLDESGNPLMETVLDENGNPVFPLDENGDPMSEDPIMKPRTVGTIPNPESAGEFVAKMVLKNSIVPTLTASVSRAVHEAAEAQVKQAQAALSNSAVITVG